MVRKVHSQDLIPWIVWFHFLTVGMIFPEDPYDNFWHGLHENCNTEIPEHILINSFLGVWNVCSSQLHLNHYKILGKNVSCSKWKEGYDRLSIHKYW